MLSKSKLALPNNQHNNNHQNYQILKMLLTSIGKVEITPKKEVDISLSNDGQITGKTIFKKMARLPLQRFCGKHGKEKQENESQTKLDFGVPDNTVINWTNLGPAVVTNSSVSISGQGRFNTIIKDPNNPQTLYVGAPAGGIWKSTDDGVNWTPSVRSSTTDWGFGYCH